MTEAIYEYVIVGAGMIGSSAAKYVAEICNERKQNQKVALVGVIEEGIQRRFIKKKLLYLHFQIR